MVQTEISTWKKRIPRRKCRRRKSQLYRLAHCLFLVSASLFVAVVYIVV